MAVARPPQKREEKKKPKEKGEGRGKRRKERNELGIEVEEDPRSTSNWLEVTSEVVWNVQQSLEVD